MHDLQPMQRSPLKSTMPSARRNSAVTGQMVMHGASSQWLHLITEKKRRVSGYSPFSMYFTHVRNVPSGTSFSDLQATVQAWQPIHFRWSMTKPYLMFLCLTESDTLLFNLSSLLLTDGPMLRARAEKIARQPFNEWEAL